MGQSLERFSPAGNEEKKFKLIVPITEKVYNRHFRIIADKPCLADFYRAVCEAVEEINKSLGNTQFRLPPASKLKKSYDIHRYRSKSMTKEEFQIILQEVLITESGFTRIGAKDALIYIFGIPLITMFLKQNLFPHAIPDEVFIPGVTSATVFTLAKLRKI